MTEVEKKFAEKENALGAAVVVSGTAAIHAAISTLVRVGDNVLSSANVSEKTQNLFNLLRNDFNIVVDYLDSSDPKDYFNSIIPQTRMIFVEAGGGKTPEETKIKELSEVAHKYRIPLVVDTGKFSYSECLPLVEEADIVIRDFEKMTGGKIKGAVVSEKSYMKWAVCNIPIFKAADPTFGNIRWVYDLKGDELKIPFIMRFKGVTEKCFGTALSENSANELYSKISDFLKP